jgi:hypothetical protein
MKTNIIFNSQSFFSIFFFISIFFCSISHASNEHTKSHNSDCIRKFLIFDIGSSTTKSILYTKDVCNNNKTIKKETFNKNYPYQSCLSDSDSNVLPERCVIEGVKVISIIKEHFQLNCHDDSQCTAIATGWARNTRNINDWISAVKDINVKPVIASQMYEGEMKLNAIKTIAVNAHQPFIAFDIGGASFQLGWFGPNNKLHQHNGQYGTDNFTHDLQAKFLSEADQKCAHTRNKVILLENGEKSDSSLIKNALKQQEVFCNVTSLASVHPKDIEKAIKYADEKIGAAIRDNHELQKFITENKPIIYGDSLLLSLGLKKQLGFDKHIVTTNDIYKVMQSVSGMTYTQIKSIYPNLPDICINTTQASMLILYTIMKSLNIDEMHIIQSDYMGYFVDSHIKK